MPRKSNKQIAADAEDAYALGIVQGIGLHSLYATFVEASQPGRITFHYIIQRLMVLIQQPLAFILLEKNKENDHIKIRYTFNNDPVALHRLANKYRSQFSGNDEGRERYLFNIYNSRYYLMCARVEHLDNENDERFHFIPNNDSTDRGLSEKDKYVAGLVKAIFFKRELVDEMLPNFSKHTINSIDRLPNNRKVFIEGKHYLVDEYYVSEEHQPIKAVPDRNYRRKFNRLFNHSGAHSGSHADFGPLNLAFSKVQHSLATLLLELVVPEPKEGETLDLFGGSDESIPLLNNFLFLTARGLADGEQARCGAYDYGLNIAVCSEQEGELVAYFTSLLNMGKTSFSKKYLLYPQAVEVTKIDPRFVKALDEEFWERLNDKGVEEIIRILVSDFGPNMRSVADPVFYNRYIHFSFPMEASGLNRIKSLKGFTKVSDIPISDMDDALRVVITYYLWFGMMSHRDRKMFEKPKRGSIASKRNKLTNIVLITVPIEVQGAVYGAVCHFAFLRSPEESVSVRNSLWNRNITLCQSIDTRFRRKLRLELEVMYFDYIVDTFAKNFRALFDSQSIQNAGHLKLSNIHRVMNHKLDALLQFIPFDAVELSFYDIEGFQRQEFDFDFVEGLILIRVEFRSNRYFRKVVPGRFMNHRSLIRRLELARKEIVVQQAVNSQRSLQVIEMQ